MKKVVFVMMPVLLALSSLCTYGQDPPPVKVEPKVNEAAASPCPKISIQSAAARIVREGQPVMFVANIAGGDPKVTPNIIWNVTGGVIKDGQQTRRIDVDSTGAGADRQMVVDIWVGGYAPECSSQATATVRVAGPANKIDEFGDLAPDKESERLGSVAAALSQSNDNLYVIAYAGRGNVRGYTYTALKRIKAQLVTSGIAAGRIAAVDGGFREQPAFELWVVHEGAEAPRPTPTVDRREIIYPKTTPTRKP